MNPIIAEHILILEDYVKTQKELIDLVMSQPQDEFQLNSYIVRVAEVENKFDNLSEQLSESVVALSKLDTSSFA